MMFRLFATLLIACAGFVGQLSAAPKPDKAIFINHLPESGQFFISQTLTRFFELQTFRVSSKTFPKDTIQHQPYIRFVNNKDQYINFGSVPASVTNLAYLDQYLNKVVLHVRDPREALVSWIEYTDRHENHKFTLGLIAPVPPPEYFTWSYEQKADWQIDRFFNYSIGWLEDWLVAMRNDRALQVLPTTFEAMVTDPVAFFRDLVNFYGADGNEVDIGDLPEFNEDQFHFSPSDIDTWRTKLTPAQQQRVTALMSDDLFTTFGWQR